MNASWDVLAESVSSVFVERVGWLLVHSLWQFALVALLAVVTVRALRRRSAALRYVVLVVALAVAVAAPMATWIFQPRDVANRFLNEETSAAGQDTIDMSRPTADADRRAEGPIPANDPQTDDSALATAVAVPAHPHPAARVDPIANDAVEDPAVELPTTHTESQPSRSWFQQAKSTVRPWLAWIVAGWCLGVVLYALRPLLGWHMLRRLRRVGVSPVSDEVPAAIHRVSERLGMRRAVLVLQSTLAHLPMVVGYFKPVILLPVSLVTSIPAAQLEAILAHELAHVRRHDFLVNLLQTLVETLFFYHPAVWWLSRRIRVEREHCCDDLVVKVLGNRLEYGRALIAVEELRGRSTVLALSVNDGSLLARVRRIVGVGPTPRRSRCPVAFAGLVTLGLVLVIAFGAFVSSHAEVISDDLPTSQNRTSLLPAKGEWSGKLKTGTLAVALFDGPDAGQEQSVFPENPTWGPVVNGLRSRVVPVSAAMSEDAVDLTPRVSTFETLNDVALAVEIENVSDKPLKLAGTRYGDSYGESKGKSNSDWFGQFLFVIDYFDADGKRIERPAVAQVGVLPVVDGVQAETLEPKQTQRMLLRPAKWMTVLSQRPLLGKQRAVVRYLGITPADKELLARFPKRTGLLDAVEGEIIAPAVEFEVRGLGYRPAGAPTPAIGEADVAKNADGSDVDPAKFLVWGETVNGLRAALEVVPEVGQKALSHGTKPTLKLLVQNVGERPVSLASLMWLSELPTTAKNDKGEALPIQGTWYTGTTPAVRVLLKPQQIVTFDAGNLGLAVTKERAKKFEHVTHRKLVTSSGKVSLQTVERFGLSFLLKDGQGKVLVPLEGDWKGELKTGEAPVTITNEMIDCEIVDAVTGELVSDTTTYFAFIKPKSGDAEETEVGNLIWGPKGPGRIYFTIPDHVMQRADREELEVRWSIGGNPAYEDFSPTERIPLKQFFTDGTKAARETLSRITLTPKPNAAATKKPLEAWAYRDMDVSLLRRWQSLEGDAGSVPESRVAGLRSAIGRFIEEIDASPFSLTLERIAELKALRTRDSDQQEHTAEAAAQFVKAVFAIHGEPIQMAFNETPRPGTKTPREELERLPFGPAAPDGLRVALSCGKKQFVFGDTARLDLHLWNTGVETLVVGIGSDAPGLYPKLALHAAGRDGRPIKTVVGPEPKMVADVTFTKTWQLRPGESAVIYGYLLHVGTGAAREAAGWPAWYTVVEIADVQSGEEITLSATLPALKAPAAQAVGSAMQTGEVKIKAISPPDVAVWSATGPGQWPMPGGVTLELKRENFHGADVSTKVVLTWPKDATGITHAHTIWVASDAFGNREPWHVAWEPNSTVCWTMTGQLGRLGRNESALPAPFYVQRVDFSDKTKITTTTWYHHPEAMPENIRTEFLKAFKPLPAVPRRPSEANGSVSTFEAHDVRPIAQLLNGVWKNKDGPITVRITFPERDTDQIQWTIDFIRQAGVSAVRADLSRILSPDENAIGLFVNSDPTGMLKEEDILGKLRRGPDDTLLLDITPKPKYPDYDAAKGIVLVRDDGGAKAEPLTDAASSPSPPAMKPKHEAAQSLFNKWQASARANGNIPGGALGPLVRVMARFVELNPTENAAPKFAELLRRIDTSHDWTPADAAALLDEVTAIYANLPEWVMDEDRFTLRGEIQTGRPLPAELKNAAWGAAKPNGLRTAWLLEPRAEQYSSGTRLKSRIVIHNSGRETAVFVANSFNQAGGQARDANGSEINVSGIQWTTMGQMTVFRLAPGEFCEVTAPGFGIGARNQDNEDWAHVRIGAWIEAKAGDEVTLTPSALLVNGIRGGGGEGANGDPDWWLNFIKERLSLDSPLPADAAERGRILDRAMRELFGGAPTAEETATFTSDRAPDALDVLAKRLAVREGTLSFTGALQSGVTKFRVVATDPDAAKKTRTATGPGNRTLGDHTRLVITSRGEQRENTAHIKFASGEPYEIKLPDGHLTWAAAWEPGTTVLWVQQKGLLRKYDFADPAQVKETRFGPDTKSDEPEQVREAIKAALGGPDAQVQKEEPLNSPPAETPQKPKEGEATKLTPDALLGIWRGELNGERFALIFHRPPADSEDQVEAYFGNATIGVVISFTIAPDGSAVTLRNGGAKTAEFGRLTPGKPGTLQLEVTNKQTGETHCMLTRDHEKPASEPRQKEARELFAMWKRTANADGTIPGTFIGKLAEDVRIYVKKHPSYDSGMKLPKLLPRFVTSRDWTEAEAIKLLDDVAYYTTEPITARVAKSKLPSGPMWRTDVCFEDIPVKIAKWSEPLNGLRIGMRIAGGEWRVGGKVRVELWLHNAGQKDLNFVTTGPDRSDAGLSAVATDDDGKEHWAVAGSMGLIALQLPGELAAGHVAKVKDFELPFAASESPDAARFGPAFLGLKPGKFTLRCHWLDAAGPADGNQKDGARWNGSLRTPEMEFTLASGADVPANQSEEITGARSASPVAAGAANESDAVPVTKDADPFAAPADPEQLADALKTAHRLRVLDASGMKPLREFRVVAGVRSGVSREFETTHGTRVANWQSHTIHAGRDGVMLWPLGKSYDEMVLRVEADGFVPQLTDWIKKGDGPQDLTLKLMVDPGVAGLAMLPQGRPATDATVVLAMARREVILDGDLGELRHAKAPAPQTLRDRWDRPRIVTADKQGRFNLPTEPDPTAAVLILHGDAMLELPFADFQKTPHVTLQPWGRLRGRVQWGDKPGPNESVDLIIHREDHGYPGIVEQYANTKTNAKGQFVFEKVLPGIVQLSLPFTFTEPRKDGVSSVNLPGRLVHVTAKAGEHVPVLLGGRGRTVRGRLVGRDAWDGVTFHFHPTAPHIGFPGDDAMWAAWNQFQQSESGPLFFRSGLKVNADGSFEIPQVLPGSYQIFFSRADGKTPVANGRFTVPPEDRDAPPESHDAGEFRAREGIGVNTEPRPPVPE